jgi:hypothetical protein
MLILSCGAACRCVLLGGLFVALIEIDLSADEHTGWR